MRHLDILLLLGLTATISHAATISVNLTRSGAPSETGFIDWAANDNTLPSNLSGISFGLDTLTFSTPVGGINAGTTVRSIDRGGNDGYTGPLASLTQTWWGQRQTSTGPGGFITIDIAGLSAGSYSFTSWHLDHEDQTGGMTIDFSDNNGSSFTNVVPSFDLLNFAGGGSAPADNAAAPYEATFNFVSTGADVQIRFRNNASVNSSQAFALTNGFQLASIPEPTLIPEPSSALLGGLGLLALLRRRR